MKLTTRSRYGVRMMLNLASRYGKGPTPLDIVANEEGISVKYLSQLVLPLQKVGLLNTTRGAHGGHALAKPPSEVTCKTIVETLEGSISLVDCGTQSGNTCKRSVHCVMQPVWQSLSQQLSDSLNQISLQHLLEKQESFQASVQA